MSACEHEWEWTQDWYGATVCDRCGATKDPILLRDTPEDRADLHALLVRLGVAVTPYKDHWHLADAILVELRK